MTHSHRPMRVPSRNVSAVALAVVAFVAACGPVANETPGLIETSKASARQFDDIALRDAILLRDGVGLRADEEWVRDAMADPASVERWGIAMTVEEAGAFDRRLGVQLDVVPAVVAYGEAYPQDWAGAYIDERSGAIVASFTRDFERHRAALVSLFTPRLVELRVREVHWTTAELNSLNETLWTADSQGWIVQQGLSIIGGGARVVENDVHLELSSPLVDPDLAGRIVEHFRGVGWLNVSISVRPQPPTAFGSLELVVNDANGHPVSGVYCWLTPDIAGYAGDNVIRIADSDGLCAWEGLGAGWFTVRIWQTLDDGLLLTERVLVEPGELNQSTLTVTIGRPVG